METATMTSPTPSLPLSIIGETKATDAEIDAYATKILSTMSPPETSFIDDSLGPYVTSLLRCADIQDKRQVKNMTEFDSILELLEDQCSMGEKEATECVILIADAVITQVVPFSERTSSSSSTKGGCSTNHFGLYTPQGGSMDAFQSMMNDLPNSIDTIVTASATPLSKIIGRTDAGGPSPLKPDNLIPIDLMGELDDPSPDYSTTVTSALHVQEKDQLYPQTSYGYKDAYSLETIQSPTISTSVSNPNDGFPPLGSSSAAFPPLGASTEKPKKSRNSKKYGKSQHHSDKDLAATLFRPARPRQNSIESEEAVSRSRGSSNASTSMTTTISTIDEGSSSTNNIYFQQQLNSCVEILLSMTQDLSEEAASSAGLMANTDFNLAQHIIDSALSQPPICRHMLHNGCYRSDCTFSHDVETHTCLFWLRGRCGKGSACKFLHGFHEKLLNGIDRSKYQADQQTSKSASYSQLYPLYQGSSPPSASCTPAFSSSMNISFGGGISPLLSSSWQTAPSLEGTSGGSVTSMPSSSSESAPFSFANIASKGYDKNQFSEIGASSSFKGGSRKDQIRTVRIPQDLWNAHENRDSSVFYISDPLERYQKVSTTIQRTDVIDLHFQSVKTFPIVLETMLPLKLNKSSGEPSDRQVWIITGTGHHVGTKTHQKGGGALESAVISWLAEHNYKFCRGKDRNGQGGALLVNR